MISEETKRYLKKKEWSMGHGQCDECCGLGPDWPNWKGNPGHHKDCGFARLLLELGMDVLYKKGRD
jgi:hypothetical protein